MKPPTSPRRAGAAALLITCAAASLGADCEAPTGTEPVCLGAEPGEGVVYSDTGCIEYQRGTGPLVISVPHGGYLEPDGFPDRRQGSSVNDAVTQELGRELADAIEARTGQRPHLIICRLARIKLDANRDIDEAAEGNAAAEAEWRAYHGFIEEALEAVRVEEGRGFYVDLHGQSHDPGRTQLGFSTTADALALDDATLDAGGYVASSSLGPVVASSPSPFSEVLRGGTSLGGRLAAQGHPTVPSPDDPEPGDVTYWNTGYSSYEHGPLQEAPWVGSVLFETANAGVRDTVEHRQAFAEDLADTLGAFLGDHFQR